MLVILLIVASLVPQKSRHSPADFRKWEKNQPTFYKIASLTELNNVLNSKIFFLTLGLMLINISLCSYNHLTRTLQARRNWLTLDLQKINRQLRKKETLSIKKRPGFIMEIQGLLKRHFYSTSHEKGLVIAFKNSWGFWGVVVFHLALIVTVAGAFLARSDRMEGYVRMTENEVFTEDHNSYLRISEGPFFGNSHQKFQMLLNDFEIEYWPNGRTKVRKSNISIADGGEIVKKGSTRPNYPLIYKGFRILQSSKFGWSALFDLQDEQGQINSGSVRIDTPKSSKKKATTDFLIPGTDYEAELKLKKKPKVKSKKFWMEYNPQDLSLDLKVSDKDDGVIYDGNINLNQSIKLEDKNLTLDSFSSWTSFVISKDSGTQVIYFGFWMALIGLSIMYLIIPKKIYILVTKKEDYFQLRLSGKTRKYFKNFKEEINSISQRLLD